MAEKVVVYWRDIPAQVIVKAGRKTAKRQLSERFEQAIDRAAMRARMTGTDAYLEQIWRPRRQSRPRRWRRSTRPSAYATWSRRAAPSATVEPRMYALRLWSIRHAGFWERFYQRFERAYVAAGPMLKRVGFARLEGSAALIERNVKGLTIGAVKGGGRR